eukprot:scaffold209201_cov50-Prasinocladus_malaysianus.AAC.2
MARSAAFKGGHRGVSPFGQRGHDLRVVTDECGVHALLLEVFAHQLVQQPRGRVGRRAVDFPLVDLCYTEHISKHFGFSS